MNDKMPLGYVPSQLRTPQEEILLGGTLGNLPEREEDWHKPQGVLSGKLSVREARAQRKMYPYLVSPIIGAVIGLKDPLVLGVCELDETGTTTHDPEIFGLYNAETKSVDPLPSDQIKDFTERLYEKFESSDMNLHRRSTLGEGQSFPSLERY